MCTQGIEISHVVRGIRSYLSLERTLILALEHRYNSKSFYYVAIILDAVLRFLWVVSLAPKGGSTFFGTTSFYLDPFLGALEISRRGMWSIIRMESQQISNHTSFRSLGAIPMSFATRSRAMDLEADALEAEDSKRRRSKMRHRKRVRTRAVGVAFARLRTLSSTSSCLCVWSLRLLCFLCCCKDLVFVFSFSLNFKSFHTYMHVLWKKAENRAKCTGYLQLQERNTEQMCR